MGNGKQITADVLKKQIELYTVERPTYETYARSLKKALERACAVSIPEASVQARAKTVSSFAEKCVRKYGKYQDPVHQLTDLCGARVIVQTVEQVEAVKQFVEANFVIHEQDEKGTLLGDDRFGYRDMHYIIGLKEDRAADLGLRPATLLAIGARKAELQVRTWLQHAWADTLHDRIYKNPLQLPADIKRTGNLLAALMEEGDRSFNTMAHEIDGMTANYAAFAAKDKVAEEIATQRLILDSEPRKVKKSALALSLARLLAAGGDHQGVVDLLDPYRDVADANQCELLVMLGYALCKQHRADPSAAGYGRGLATLKTATDFCLCSDLPFVPNLRKRESLHARALARLAWALEAVPGQRDEATRLWREAHEHEPENPYYLAGMLTFEAVHARHLETATTMCVTVRQAIKTCQAHIVAGTEMPEACFAAGRLSLLQNQANNALAYYARGIRYVLEGTRCVPADALQDESGVITKLLDTWHPPLCFRWASTLLGIGAKLESPPEPTPISLPTKAILIVGGAGSIDATAIARFRPLLEAALTPFAGTVVSGGTAVGVPGCVGDITRSLSAAKACRYTLLGYVPRLLPADAPRHDAYDLRESGEGEFTAEQVLQGWHDLLADGITPREILCLGFGGGKISALEYRIALALGATVAVAPARPAKEGDAAAQLAADPLWAGMPNLFPIPLDPTTLRALVAVPAPAYPPKTLEQMGKLFHTQYVSNSTSRLPDSMRPWDKLPDTYKTANLEQAKYAVQVLESCGFAVREAADPAKPTVFDQTQFTDEEVESMAEMEHGRWNVERLRNGWRYAPEKDELAKLHPCLVPWPKLPDGPDGVKKYDREAVRSFPAILAKAGLEVYRT